MRKHIYPGLMNVKRDMKFTVKKDALLEGLASVPNVVSSQTTLAILSNVLIEASNGLLRLTTTDLDLRVCRSVQAPVEQSGEITLPARHLLSIVHALPEGDLSFEANGQNVATIRSGTVQYKLLGLAAEDFPPLSPPGESNVFTLPAKAFKEALQRTCYAASEDDSRCALKGAFFSFKANKLRVVATDGRRLALAEFEVEFPVSSETEFIVPTKALNEIMRLLEADGELTLHVCESQIAVELEGVLLVSKLIAASFPNYQQVIPTQPGSRVELDRETFLAAVRRASLLADAKSRSIKLVFSPGNVEIVAVTPDVGEARESVTLKYQGGKRTVAFNPDYLVAPLKSLSPDDVSLDLMEDTSPGVIRADGTFLYVLMPLRVENE
jgi:DNA polymerase III subunit beta